MRVSIPEGPDRSRHMWSAISEKPALRTPPARAGIQSFSSESAASCSWAIPWTRTITAIACQPYKKRLCRETYLNVQPQQFILFCRSIKDISCIAQPSHNGQDPGVGERRLIVIGSQCDKLNRLSFLPTVAAELYEVMTDPKIGACVSALEGSGLLHDPSVDTARTAIAAAFQRASQDGATLFLVFIGHGEYAGEDFYLLPKDASMPPRAHSAIHLVQSIKELHREYSYVDGLVVLLDACYAGVAAEAAAAAWVRELKGTLRFVIFSAVGADRPAADGCFSRSLTSVIRDGLPDVPSEYLHCERVKPVVEKLCPKQRPSLPTWDYDEGLYLAKNVARSVRKGSWIGTRAAAEIERLLSCFQPTPQLEELVEAAKARKYIALTGLAGVGKSALSAALARPDVTEGIVPEAFAHAVAFVSEVTTSWDLASELSKQLRTAIPDFAAARDQFFSQVRADERAQLDTLQQEILRPLQLLELNCPVRIVVDGLDRLSRGAVLAVNSALEALATDSALSAVRLVVTSRPDTPLPGTPEKIQLGRTDDQRIASYLQRRAIPLNFQADIVQKARGNWLIARLLADLALTPPTARGETLPRDLVEIYDSVLRRAGAIDQERWRTEFRPVLGVLAAAGVGPILPLELLCAASERLGGPSRPTRMRDVLVNVRGFVVRGRPGTDDEQVGVFHQTFAEYLLNPGDGAYGIEAKEPHGAILDAIAELAPMEQDGIRKPVQRYAAAAEAEHFWAIGNHSKAIASLEERNSAIPAENLARWHSWLQRIEQTCGHNNRNTLRARYNIARWTGETGDAREALRLFEALHLDTVSPFCSDDRDTLLGRHQIAYWTGETGDAREALRLFEELHRDVERLFGSDDRDTLLARQQIARWTGEIGDAVRARDLFEKLLRDLRDLRVPCDRDTLRTQISLAYWSGMAGDAVQARRSYEELLPVLIDRLGISDPETLLAGQQIAYWTRKTGEPGDALRSFRTLLPELERVLGSTHPDVLWTRKQISELGIELGA